MPLPTRSLPCFLIAAVLFADIARADASKWSLQLPAASFARSYFAYPGFEQKVRGGGSLSGAKGESGFNGWVEYDFEVPASAWYRLAVRGGANETEFLVDPDAEGNADFRFFGGTGWRDGEEKIGNAWLSAGKHRLRVQRYYWTGFPRIDAILLRAAGTALGDSVFATTTRVPIFRTGECAPLEVRTGGLSGESQLHVWIRDGGNNKVLRTEVLPINAPSMERRKVTLPCSDDGIFVISFGDGKREIPSADIRSLVYEVVAPGVPAQATGKQGKTLVMEIDCTTRQPDYYGGGATTVNRTAAGSYRESGDTGFTRFQRTPDPARKLLPEPSWFAYRLDGLAPQTSYLVEVDYPDDQFRTFAIALRETKPLSYPVAGGVDSGGEFSLTRGMLTHSLIYWPRADGTRVTFLNAHDGRRAAAARIRVYRIDGALPALIPNGGAGRQFVNWYEEGGNVFSTYGAPDNWYLAPGVVMQRWAEAVRHIGGTVLAPTVVVYDFALYPSRYNRNFSRPDFDFLRRTLLVSEKYGLKVLPELHPRADELDWTFASSPDPKPHLLISREGRTHYYGKDGRSRVFPPLLNPLHPTNQDWYVGMIGELVDTYRDSPALMGVNLRLMQWANPSLNNFNSLDWGYDDFTVGLFKQETGSPIPMGSASDPQRYSSRHAWLMKNAREQWIGWRCAKIVQLYTRIRDRVRQARGDLNVYSSVFPWETGADNREALRGAGIDVELLGKVDGISLINATQGYGRREADAQTTQRARDALLEPGNLNLVPGSHGRFLTGAYYLEATQVVAPPSQLGMDARTKLTWTSAAINPAGRHALERYAVQLAETDAGMLGDGGNGYSLGQPQLREFMTEYLSLPPEPFSPRAEARDPVAVWERATAESLLFYAVNRERYPVSMELVLPAGADVTRLATGQPVPLENGKLRITLKPYQLIAFRASRAARIGSITTHVPAAVRSQIAEQVRWLQSLAQGQDERWFSRLRDEEKSLLSAASRNAADALGRGELWRARTSIEHHDLLEIYGKIGEYPPHLREGIPAL